VVSCSAEVTGNVVESSKTTTTLVETLMSVWLWTRWDMSHLSWHLPVTLGKYELVKRYIPSVMENMNSSPRAMKWDKDVSADAVPHYVVAKSRDALIVRPGSSPGIRTV
jgi:hypothetical protein